jgi:hypothetical protein
VDSLNTDGLAPSLITGRWGGGDSIDVLISLHLHRDGAAITNSADPDTGPDQRAALERGTEAEFTALCRGLTG